MPVNLQVASSCKKLLKIQSKKLQAKNMFTHGLEDYDNDVGLLNELRRFRVKKKGEKNQKHKEEGLPTISP